MALINCPECKREISDKASACPGCGAPVGVTANSEEVTTIQETGKGLKAQQAVAILLMIAGMAGCVMDPNGTGLSEGETSVGFWVFIVGAVWFLIIRLNMWWEHG